VTQPSNTPWPPSAPNETPAPPPRLPAQLRPRVGGCRTVTRVGRTWPDRARSPWKPSSATPPIRVVMMLTRDELLTHDDMPAFTRLRMTAFGQAVIDIANDPAFDEWTFSAKIRHALAKEINARGERRLLKLLKASRTPNLGACVEDLHYLPERSLNRDVVARLSACGWIDRCANLVILGPSSVGKSYLAQALVHSAARHDYTVRYYRLDDLANQLAVLDRADPARLRFLGELHNCDLLVLDDFLTTPITGDIAAEILNILAARDGRGSTA